MCQRSQPPKGTSTPPEGYVLRNMKTIKQMLFDNVHIIQKLDLSSAIN